MTELKGLQTSLYILYLAHPEEYLLFDSFWAWLNNWLTAKLKINHNIKCNAPVVLTACQWKSIKFYVGAAVCQIQFPLNFRYSVDTQ